MIEYMYAVVLFILVLNFYFPLFGGLQMCDMYM